MPERGKKKESALFGKHNPEQKQNKKETTARMGKRGASTRGEIPPEQEVRDPGIVECQISLKGLPETASSVCKRRQNKKKKGDIA